MNIFLNLDPRKRKLPFPCCEVTSVAFADDGLGLRWDRRFMIVNATNGAMVTQREKRKLAVVRPALHERANEVRYLGRH